MFLIVNLLSAILGSRSTCAQSKLSKIEETNVENTQIFPNSYFTYPKEEVAPYVDANLLAKMKAC